MKDTFNSDFYVTAATIIPVLYLALTLQSPAFDMILTWWKKFLVQESGTFRRANKRFWVACFIVVAGVSVLINSLFGEIYTIQALYNRSNTGKASFILVSVIILTIAVIGVTCWRIIATFYNATRESSNIRSKAPGSSEAVNVEGKGTDA
jgi:formate hydrogenlyase subunit 3/multisubunit Na+/H+ antiporter MnhD subunit